MKWGLKLLVTYFIFFFAAIILGLKSPNQDASSEKIISSMQESIRNIESLQYTIKNTERIDGELLSGTQNISYQSDPFKCLVRMIEPNSGATLYYAEGENDNQARYDPNGFPFIQMNLDPMGNLVRKNNHHTIYEIGFSFFSQIIEDLKTNSLVTFHFLGETTWKNRSCYKISVVNKGFHILEHKVQVGETTRIIASNKNISEYMIIELNEEIDNFNEELIPGQIILVPNSYAPKFELFVDALTYLPVYQKISDQKGIYEIYEFSNIKSSPFRPEG